MLTGELSHIIAGIVPGDEVRAIFGADTVTPMSRPAYTVSGPAWLNGDIMQVGDAALEDAVHIEVTNRIDPGMPLPFGQRVTWAASRKLWTIRGWYWVDVANRWMLEIQALSNGSNETVMLAFPEDVTAVGDIPELPVGAVWFADKRPDVPWMRNDDSEPEHWFTLTSRGAEYATWDELQPGSPATPEKVIVEAVEKAYNSARQAVNEIVDETGWRTLAIEAITKAENHNKGETDHE